MNTIPFQLSNEQRKYLGLVPVEEHWELVELAGSYVYFDGDVIRKKIKLEDGGYYECELAEVTAENRTMLLPKTAKGKTKKLNYTATLSFKPLGVYFSFSAYYGYVSIANYTTQKTWYSGKIKTQATLDDLQGWLNEWIATSTEQDLADIEQFKNEKRQHQKYKEGDFFAFKIGRREWGFGRILIDVATRRKTVEFKQLKHSGLTHLMGKALIVKIYHKKSTSLDLNLDELSKQMALPSQAVMDNTVYYGEFPIIGHLPLMEDEYDMLISYSQSIDSENYNLVYLQYGFIYLELPIDQFNLYLTKRIEGYGEADNPYRNEGIGYGVDIKGLSECIRHADNHAFWANGLNDTDLRHPENKQIKTEIFAAFGLDANKSYAENFAIFNKN